jgi:hypothetical protein
MPLSNQGDDLMPLASPTQRDGSRAKSAKQRETGQEKPSYPRHRTILQACSFRVPNARLAAANRIMRSEEVRIEETADSFGRAPLLARFAVQGAGLVEGR